MNDKVKVFISWSGDLAKDVAVALRDWLPDVFDNVAPWASDTDIEAGSRSLDEIHSALNDSVVGIVIVTMENQQASWLNYEAGALAKTVAPMRSRVIPLLVDIDSPTQLIGPIAQFQAKRLNQADMLDVLTVIGGLSGVEAQTVERRTQTFWPAFDAKLREAKDQHASRQHAGTPRRTQGDMLEEVLSHVRALREIQAPSDPNQAFRETIQSIRSEGASRNLEFTAKVFRSKDGKRRIVLVAPFNPWAQGIPEALLEFASEMKFLTDIDVRVVEGSPPSEEPPF